jgi:hypothetical protein
MEPPYPFGGANEPVELFDGVGVVEQAAARVSGQTRITLDWLPTPSFRFHLETDGWIELGNKSLLKLPALDASAQVVLTRLNADGLSGHLSRVAFGNADDLVSLAFMVPNMPPTAGGSITDGQTHWRGRVVLESPPWKVTLDPTLESRDLLDEVKQKGGFALTHVGKLERGDGRPFAASDADHVLSAVHHFLSFANGLWTPPLLLVGSGDSPPVWREWWARNATSWRNNITWFSSRHPDALVAAFPSFMQRWDDPRWRPELQSAITWLLEAMRQPFADIAIALAQNALELLGWVILVEERKLLSKTKYKDQPARDNLQRLLEWAGIPTAIPGELTELLPYAASEGWQTGPQAVAAFRNTLVHPRDRTRHIFEMPLAAKFDLQALGFWYVELVLLRFIGYRGDYVNRHRAEWVGHVEPVPWA